MCWPPLNQPNHWRFCNREIRRNVNWQVNVRGQPFSFTVLFSWVSVNSIRARCWWCCQDDNYIDLLRYDGILYRPATICWPVLTLSVRCHFICLESVRCRSWHDDDSFTTAWNSTYSYCLSDILPPALPPRVLSSRSRLIEHLRVVNSNLLFATSGVKWHSTQLAPTPVWGLARPDSIGPARPGPALPGMQRIVSRLTVCPW